MRKIIIAALVGSHNYNLNGKDSDRDYKVFVAPTFDDLYSGKLYSSSQIGQTQDLDLHDIRKLPKMLWKSNVNFLEVLHSKDLRYDTNDPLLCDIFQDKERFSRMNLPYLYASSIGMAASKKKMLDKGTSNTIHLVEKYGYDTKQAMHAYRILDFVIRFAVTGFRDFTKAMRYEDSRDRSLLLSIKNGVFAKDDFIDMLAEKFAAADKIKDHYLSQKPNEGDLAFLEGIIKKIVKKNMD